VNYQVLSSERYEAARLKRLLKAGYFGGEIGSTVTGHHNDLRLGVTDLHLDRKTDPVQFTWHVHIRAHEIDAGFFFQYGQSARGIQSLNHLEASLLEYFGCIDPEQEIVIDNQNSVRRHNRPPIFVHTRSTELSGDRLERMLR